MTLICYLDDEGAPELLEIGGEDGTGSAVFEAEPGTTTPADPDQIAAAVSDALQPYFATIIFVLAVIAGLSIGRAVNWFKW